MVGPLDYPPAVRREIEHWRGLTGKEMPRVDAFNTVATVDAIRHYARGVGDDNPLWLDHEYARQTRYGCILAPPLFVYTGFPRGGLGIPSFSGLHIGEAWRFYQPVRINDEMSATFSLQELHPKQIRHARRALFQLTHYKFTNQKGELLAERTLQEFRFLPEDAVLLQDMVTPPASYSPEELKRIDEDYKQEVRRGREPRYFEDVVVGEEIPKIVKGPLSLRDVVAAYIGQGSHRHMAHRFFWKFKLEHPEPEAMMVDPDTGLPEVRQMYTLKDSAAQARGLPRAIEVGTFRMANMMHLVTNWMGDDGFVVGFEAQNRFPVYFGDTYWCAGTVTSKFRPDGDHLVDLALTATNQKGQRISTGRAVVRLLSRTS